MTTPTRQDVLDALLAERIERDWERAPSRQTFKEFLAPAVLAELEAMNGAGDFDTVYASLTSKANKHLTDEILRLARDAANLYEWISDDETLNTLCDELERDQHYDDKVYCQRLWERVKEEIVASEPDRELRAVAIIFQDAVSIIHCVPLVDYALQLHEVLRDFKRRFKELKEPHLCAGLDAEDYPSIGHYLRAARRQLNDDLASDGDYVFG